MKKAISRSIVLLIPIALALILANCGGQQSVAIDGSSTVNPITKAMAERFQAENSDVTITNNYSSTGKGLERFIASETQISNASRPIKPEEVKKAEENGVEFIELPVAYDGITVIVNQENDWVDYLTVEELRKIFSEKERVAMWSEIREDWPAQPIDVFAPDETSGTYDYFSEAITGSGNHIKEYKGTIDDSLIITAVQNNRNFIGYLGLSYYLENQDKLKAVRIDGGKGAVEPSIQNVSNGRYVPLSRPLFIYVNKSAASEGSVVEQFINFYLENAMAVVKEVQYAPLTAEDYAAVQNKFKDRTHGSVFNADTSGKTIAEILSGK